MTRRPAGLAKADVIECVVYFAFSPGNVSFQLRRGACPPDVVRTALQLLLQVR